MRTTIQLDTTTRDKLKSLGKKGESYDQIILRLYEKEVQQQRGTIHPHPEEMRTSLPLHPTS
jgi:hypothetical protein